VINDSRNIGLAGVRALGVFGARRHVPELLEVIELAHARQHHVHDEIGEVDEHPLARALAFYA
jgi:hypothetical protein